MRETAEHKKVMINQDEAAYSRENRRAQICESGSIEGMKKWGKTEMSKSIPLIRITII